MGDLHSYLPHSCQVSRNSQDSPAYVLAVSRLTQKAANVPEFLQTLTSKYGAREEFISLLQAKKLALCTLFNTKPFLVLILGTVWLFATPISKNREKMGGVTKFRICENRLSDSDTWQLWEASLYYALLMYIYTSN